MELKPVYPLVSAKKGIIVKIVEIPEGKSRAQLIRLGIVSGHFVRCLERLPGGTIVIQNNRQEVALGVGLAKAILVTEHTKSERAR
jgi:Fe2+ transport system protein FeoA